MGALVLLVFLPLALTGFVAWNLLCAALFDAPNQVSRLRLVAWPLRCYLMGLCTLLLQLWLVTATGQPWMLVPLFVVDVALLSVSLPAVSVLAGERLGVHGRWAPAAGSVPLAVTLAFPVVGWLCVANLLVAAVGAATLPRFWSRA